MSEFNKQKYLESEGSQCPFCGEGNLEGHSLDFEGGGIFQNITCTSCGQEWTDHYKLVDAEPLPTLK